MSAVIFEGLLCNAECNLSAITKFLVKVRSLADSAVNCTKAITEDAPRTRRRRSQPLLDLGRIPLR